MKKASEATTAAHVICALIGLPALVAAMTVWRGYVLSILWGWLIVPAFGLPALSIPFAIGMALIVGYLSRDSGPQRKEQGLGESVAFGLAGPLVMLGIGWIVTLFIA